VMSASYCANCREPLDLPVVDSRRVPVCEETPPLNQAIRKRFYRCAKCSARTRTREVIDGVFLDDDENSINRLTNLPENVGEGSCSCRESDGELPD